jgi:hypothetical protein
LRRRWDGCRRRRRERARSWVGDVVATCEKGVTDGKQDVREREQSVEECRR